jgi:hypothetical protein
MSRLPRHQAFLAVNPAALASNDAYEVPAGPLCSALLQEPDVQLSGACREDLAHRAVRNAHKISEVLMQIFKTRPLKA